ncbi:ribosomal protein S18-alanine N-acetyltransferase [Pseudoalteromonas citrea]|nr:ribosomal protein S18-alanine N-acetyltransferase [Pseudoalteromonas citrea]
MCELMAIETACHAFPWTQKTMETCLAGRYFNGALYLDKELAGFYVGERAGPDNTLMDICIAPAHQGKGLAKALLLDFVTRSEAMSAENLFLEVRASNKAAIGLYEQAGFIESGIRKNYYPSHSGKEDAILMALALCFMGSS